MIISLTGFMGCGKSSTGRILAERLGARFVDLDAYIVAREGRSIPEIFRDGGETAFRAAELAALASVLDTAANGAASREHACTVIALGGGTFTVPAAREMLLRGTMCVYLRTRLETIRERLGAADASRPLFADAEALYAARGPVYSLAPHTVDTDGKTPADVAGEICALL